MKNAPTTKKSRERLGTAGDTAKPTATPNTKPPSPRQLRAIRALLKGHCSVSELRRAAQANNIPALIMKIRRKYAVQIPCSWISFVTIDGAKSRFGIYSLVDTDRVKLTNWMRAQ